MIAKRTGPWQIVLDGYDMLDPHDQLALLELLQKRHAATTGPQTTAKPVREAPVGYGNTADAAGAYRVQTTVSSDGTLAVSDIPFAPGQAVEVVVRRVKPPRRQGPRYPLRGTPVFYADPFSPVAQDEWEAPR